jgi:hypothetical protein
MKIYVTINGNLERGNNLQFSKFFASSSILLLLPLMLYHYMILSIVPLQSIRNEGRKKKINFCRYLKMRIESLE